MKGREEKERAVGLAEGKREVVATEEEEEEKERESLEMEKETAIVEERRGEERDELRVVLILVT